MRKAFCLIVVMTVVIVAFTGCDKVDPIHNGDPVDTTLASRFPLSEFHRLGQDGDTVAQKNLVDRYRKLLTANVVRHYPTIQNEESIHFILGSGFAEDVLSGNGETHSGNFKNELIIVIDDEAVKDTVFLACGNGMLRPLKFHDSIDLGTAEQWRFTIGKGEGLAHHLPALQEWSEVANNLSIPIKDKDGKVVNEEIFSNYLGRYQSLLFEGDVVDIIAGKVYNKAGQEVDFQRRQAETKKANKARAKRK